MTKESHSYATSNSPHDLTWEPSQPKPPFSCLYLSVFHLSFHFYCFSFRYLLPHHAHKNAGSGGTGIFVYLLSSPPCILPGI